MRCLLPTLDQIDTAIAARIRALRDRLTIWRFRRLWRAYHETLDHKTH